MGCMGFGDSTNGMHTWTLPEKKLIEIITIVGATKLHHVDSAVKSV